MTTFNNRIYDLSERNYLASHWNWAAESLLKVWSSARKAGPSRLSYFAFQFLCLLSLRLHGQCLLVELALPGPERFRKVISTAGLSSTLPAFLACSWCSNARYFSHAAKDSSLKSSGNNIRILQVLWTTKWQECKFPLWELLIRDLQFLLYPYLNFSFTLHGRKFL